MKPPCPACGYIHTSNDARAIGRFAVNPMFAAAHAEAPRRATRAEAEADECVWRQERTLTTPPPFVPSLESHPPAVIVERPAMEPAPFPAVEMETAARAKAWSDFLGQVRMSLLVWEIDGEVRDGCEHVLAWLRRCRDDLAEVTPC